MNEHFLLLISALVEVLIAYQLFNHFVQRRDTNKVKSTLVSMILIITLTSIGLLKIFLFNTFMAFLLYILYILIMFRGKWWQAALWSLIFVLLGMASEIVTSFSVSYAFNVHIENTMIMTWYKVIVYIISKSILYILVKIIITVFNSNKELESDKTVLYLISFPVLAIMNEHLLIRLTMQSHLSLGITAFSLIIGVGLILGGFILIAIYDRVLQKKQLERELLLAQSKAETNEKFVLLQERNLEEARATVHDFKNQLINLKVLYEDPNSNAFIFHEELMDSLKRQMNRQLIDINNRVLSNILARVQIRCEQLNIDFNSQISHYDFGFIESIDTSSLFDNAFDNAIQACAEMDNNKKRWICFKVFIKHSYLICEIANSHVNLIKAGNGELVSSKSDMEHHGIGIRNIRTTAYKYGGDISYSYNDSEFNLIIRLTLSK